MQRKKLLKAMLALPAVVDTKTTTTTESMIVVDTTTLEIHKQNNCNDCDNDNHNKNNNINNDSSNNNNNSNNNYQFDYNYGDSNNYRLNLNNNNKKQNNNNTYKHRTYRHATQSIETARALNRRKTMEVNDTSGAATTAAAAVTVETAAAVTGTAKVNTTKETTTTTTTIITTSRAASAHNTTSGSYSLASDTLAGVLNLFLLNVTLLTAAATTTTDFASLIDADGSDLQLVSNGNNVSNSSSSSGSSSGNDSGSGSNYNTTTTITTTQLNEPHMEYIFDNTYIRILFIVLYTLCFCCCVFGNLLVILVVTCSRRLRSITNFFLANLALADFCVGVFCVMQNLSIYLIDSWVFGEFLCRMYQFVHSLSYTASIFILVVICMERYFAIVHPITCKQILTAARLRIVILTVWITAAVYSTPKFVFSKTIQNVHDDGHEEEICVLDRKMYNSKLLDMINFVLLYAIPLLVMTVLYSKIAITLWRSSRGFSHHIAQQHDNSMGMHNSMYHHHPHHHHHHLHHHHHREQQHQQQTPNTPIMGNSAGSMLSRKQSSKYEKRGVSITESQNDSFEVSLESDRPIVSACRNKASFYQHHNHHNQHHHHQQQQHQSLQQQHHQHQHPQPQQLQRHGGAQRGASHMSHSSNNVLRARRGVVRMLIIFVLTFAICNLPIHARKMWQYWGQSYRGDSNFNALLTPLTFLFSYFNSGVNPLLYAFLSRNFRKGMKELLLCSWKKSKGKSSTNSLMHHKRTALQQTHSLPTDTTHIGNEQL